MTRWTELVMSHMYPWPIGVLVTASAISLLFGLIGIWLLWRVRRMLKALPAVEGRLETLTHSVSLLSDTTEACFKAISMQMQFMQAQNTRPLVVPSSLARTRAAEPDDDEEDDADSRQHRVMGATRRGEATRSMAAREDVAESEVALRLHLSRGAQAADRKSHGSLLL